MARPVTPQDLADLRAWLERRGLGSVDSIALCLVAGVSHAAALGVSDKTLLAAVDAIHADEASDPDVRRYARGIELRTLSREGA